MTTDKNIQLGAGKIFIGTHPLDTGEGYACSGVECVDSLEDPGGPLVECFISRAWECELEATITSAPGALDLLFFRPRVIAKLREALQDYELLPLKEQEKLINQCTEVVVQTSNEIMKAFGTVFKNVGVIMNNCILPAVENVAQRLRDYVEALESAYDTLQTCPNRRVAHLAIHGKKWRTRKKNMNRAYRLVRGRG